jgi:hypothetical protein
LAGAAFDVGGHCCIEPRPVILTRNLPAQCPAGRHPTVDPDDLAGPPTPRTPADGRSCGQDRRASLNATVPPGPPAPPEPRHDPSPRTPTANRAGRSPFPVRAAQPHATGRTSTTRGAGESKRSGKRTTCGSNVAARSRGHARPKARLRPCAGSHASDQSP